MAESDNFIIVLTSAVEGRTDPNRGFREITQNVIGLATQIPAEKLRSNFEAFVKNVLGLLNAVPEDQSGYKIEEIELSAEISSEGKVQLVGGLSAGMKGGITFKLKRFPADSEHHA